MAMNEDSVVASLNELRRMANDRARRETEARASVPERGGWEQPRGQGGRRRTTEIQGGDAGHNPTLMGGHDAGQAPQLGYGGGYGYGYGYNQAAQQAAFPDVPVEPPRQKSSVGPVLLTILLLGGAAGGGYWKLQQDWQATLKARDAALLAAEEGRNKAVEVAAKAEQLAKLQAANCTKTAAPAAAAPTPAATTAAAPAAAAAAAVVPPAPSKPVAAKMSKAEKKKARRAAAAAARRSVARAPAPPVVEEKPAVPVPKLANKKKLNDDPLAGLKM